MINKQNDLHMDEFELGDILPKFITNAKGEKEPFDIERIKKSLVIDIGIDDDLSDEIIEAVIRKIVGLLSLSYKTISTYAIKEFICNELNNRNLIKYREIYERIEEKKRTKFILPEEFIKNFRGKQPKWGPLGYITYKRTYARIVENKNRTEEYFETVRRVVEGCFSMQKEHCLKLSLPWDEEKALKSAKIMYQKIWEFKFSPPGRGLWVMGTPFIDKHGSMALNNCGFASTDDIDVKGPMAFQWCMDALMLGVGVGFDTKGAGKITIKKPKESNSTFVIPDSREGWVKALGKVLEGYFYGKSIPEFDYNAIRPAGAPIRGFGGVASGPAPLKEMLKDVKLLLNNRIGEKIHSSDIVDIFNMIGKCVVAGNVRRSAEIALGSMDDEEFITLKQDQEKLIHHRWASNNSVIATVGMDYSPIIDSIAKNGEPGVIWLENAQKFSRMNGKPDYKDNKAAGVNPCVTGDTLIAVADGRNAVSISQLAEEDRDVPVYCKDENGLTVIRMMRNPRITGFEEQIYQVTLDDGSTIRCTGNHEFLMRDMSKKEAIELKSGDSLMITSKWQTTWDEIMGESEGKKKNAYWMLNDGNNNTFEHTTIYESYHNTQIPQGNVIHHKDHDGLNNRIENLEMLERSKHDDLHDISGENNPMRKWFPNATTDENYRYRKRMSKATSGSKNGRYSGYTNQEIFDAMIQYISKEQIPLTIPAWKKYAKKIGMIYNFNDFRGKLINLIKKANIKCGFGHFDNPAIMREYKRYIKLLSVSDLELKFDEGIWVIKECEMCGKGFKVKWSQREQSYCSNECVREVIRQNGPNANKIAGSIRQREAKKKTFKLFDKYVWENNKVPSYQQFIDYLNQYEIKDFRTAGIYKGYQYILDIISDRYQCASINSRKLGKEEYQLNSATMLKNHGLIYNHKVVSVRKIGVEDVYNGTVDEYHNYGIVIGEKRTKSNRPKMEIVFTANCGEQTLESFELCCLVETFPSRHESVEEYLDTLRYAYLYAKSVTLLNTHWSVTNAVMGKNRRIGTSQSGIIDAMVKHGRRDILEWCEQGYNFLKKCDEEFSDWMCIPRSVKITSVKPSGTVSLLPGVSPGIHYPHSEYYIRRIRIAKNSPLIDIVKDAGYNIEDDIYSDHAYVVEFPIHEQYFDRSKKDVSIWEQFENAAAYQKHWSDNQVSITITFTKDEAKDLKYCLEVFEDKLKGVSLLPIKDHGYKQAPYEAISKEKYEELMKNVKPMNFEHVVLEAEGEEGCETDACLLKKEMAKIKEAINKKQQEEAENLCIKQGDSILGSDFCLDDDEDGE